MINRDYLKIANPNYVLKECHVDSVGDTVWDIYDPKKGNSFVVHSFENGKLYIHFFKRGTISRECSYNGLKKLCEVLLERNLCPTIVIKPRNTALINLCRKIGFRRSKHLRNEYFLRSLT